MSNLTFKVIEKSAECTVVLKIDNLKGEMVQTEFKEGFIEIENTSSRFSIKNIYTACSHPLLLNITHKKLLDVIPPK